MKSFHYFLTLLVLIGLCGGMASASSTLDFTLSPCGATGQPKCSISYAGGLAPLVGTGIPVTAVLGIDTPANSGVTVPIIAGTLAFTTGPFSGSTANQWNFSSGGTVTISGCADIDLDGGLCDASDVSGLLASGSFADTPSVFKTGGTNNIFGAIGLDIKNPALLAFFAMPNATYNFGANYSFKTAKTPPSAFTSTQGFSGDFVQSVSEPASLALLGAGLLGLAFLARRKVTLGR